MSTIGGSCSSLATQLFDQATIRAQNQHSQTNNDSGQGAQVPLTTGTNAISEDNKGVYIDVFA